MKIEVTAEDIEKGNQGNCWRCPVALALMRAFQTNRVSVTGPYAQIKGERFDLPNKVQRFISSFDKGTDVTPFTFQLPLEAQSSLSSPLSTETL